MGGAAIFFFLLRPLENSMTNTPGAEAHPESPVAQGLENRTTGSCRWRQRGRFESQQQHFGFELQKYIQVQKVQHRSGTHNLETGSPALLPPHHRGFMLGTRLRAYSTRSFHLTGPLSKLRTIDGSVRGSTVGLKV